MCKVNIDEKIQNFDCPDNYICIVATTCYAKEERERICKGCWLNYCKQNNLDFFSNENT